MITNTIANKKKIRKQAFNYLGKFGDNIKTKFDNISGKTGSYYVPDELFQKRTSRSSRALIPWKSVKQNRLSMEQLETFEGGIVVDFVNEDFFDPKYSKDELFNELKARLGGDDSVSAIISIKTEQGSSSSAIPRRAFEKLVHDTKVVYNGKTVEINRDNYRNYVIDRPSKDEAKLMKKYNKIMVGKGNAFWTGFLYVSIRGGQQDSIETHNKDSKPLFNPVCEYASDEVIEDMNLILCFYALKSIKRSDIKTKEEWREYKLLEQNIADLLKKSEYDLPEYKGNLYDFAVNQYSISFGNGEELIDPIQYKPIDICDFNVANRVENSVDLTHEEAVDHEKLYWDKKKKCVLSPARPTNVFWSFHMSNMMQQNCTLEQFFALEKERYCKRYEWMKKNKKIV